MLALISKSIKSTSLISVLIKGTVVPKTFTSDTLDQYIWTFIHHVNQRSWWTSTILLFLNFPEWPPLEWLVHICTNDKIVILQFWEDGLGKIRNSWRVKLASLSCQTYTFCNYIIPWTRPGMNMNQCWWPTYLHKLHSAHCIKQKIIVLNSGTGKRS